MGNYAAALATPFNQRPIFVYLRQRSGTWKVVVATSIPSLEVLRQNGIPDQLSDGNDQYAVIDAATSQLQDPQGTGIDAYITRPRVSGNYARLWYSPAISMNVDNVSAFYKKENGAWHFLTAGTAFPEDQLRDMGVPQELWPYGEPVKGPRA